MLVADLWILKSLLLEVFNRLLVHPSLVCSPGSTTIDPAVTLPALSALTAFKLILGLFICTLLIPELPVTISASCSVALEPAEPEGALRDTGTSGKGSGYPKKELCLLYVTCSPCTGRQIHVRCDLEGFWGTGPCGGDGDFAAGGRMLEPQVVLVLSCATGKRTLHLPGAGPEGMALSSVPALGLC